MGGDALASSKVDQKAVPQDIISLILMHQPYMSSPTRYNLAFIKNNFPDAKDRMKTPIQKEKNNNETRWASIAKKKSPKLHLSSTSLNGMALASKRSY